MLKEKYEDSLEWFDALLMHITDLTAYTTHWLHGLHTVSSGIMPEWPDQYVYAPWQTDKGTKLSQAHELACYLERL